MTTTREEKYKGLCDNLDGFKFESITNVNHEPHPFTIGPKHIAYAANHHSGMLGEDTCRKIPCAHKGCHLPYDQHTSDTVMFLSLKRDLQKEEAQAQLETLIDAGMDRDGIDGVVFVDTNLKFRIN